MSYLTSQRLAPSPAGGLFPAGLPFSLAFGLLLGLPFSLAFGLFLGLPFSLAFGLLLYLPSFLPSGLFLRSTALLRRFSPCCYFPLLSDFALRSFFA